VLNAITSLAKLLMAMDTTRETLDLIQKGVIAAHHRAEADHDGFCRHAMLDNLYHTSRLH